MTNPTALVLRPDYSANEAGPVTPTLTGSARVVETDRPTPEYDTGIPDGTNLCLDPYMRQLNPTSLYWADQTDPVTTSVEILEDGIRWFKSNPGAVWTYGGGIVSSGTSTPLMKIPVVPGEIYTLSMDVETIGEGWVDIGFSFRTSAGVIVGSTIWDFNQYLGPGVKKDSPTLTVTVPATAAWMGYRADIYNNDNVEDYWEGTIRNFQVVKGGPVPFVDPRNDPEHSWFTGRVNASRSVRRNVKPAAKNWLTSPVASPTVLEGVGLNWGTNYLPPVADTPTGVGESFHIVTNGSNQDEGVSFAAIGSLTELNGVPLVGSGWVKAAPSNIGRIFSPNIRIIYTDASTDAMNYEGYAYAPSTNLPSRMILTGEWQRVVIPVIWANPAKTIAYGGVRLFFEQYDSTGTAPLDRDFLVWGPQVEVGFAASSYVDTENDSLARWDGVANGSTSSRLRTPSLPAWELLESTTNLFFNPHAIGSTAGWLAESGATMRQLPGVAAPGSGALGSMLYTSPAQWGSGSVETHYDLALPDVPHTAGVWIYVLSGQVRVSFRRWWNSYSNIENTAFTVVAARNQWIFVPSTFTTTNGVTYLHMRLITESDIGAAQWIVCAPQAEQKSYVTPLVPQYLPGTSTLAPGHAWVGTPHNSLSTRAQGRVQTYGLYPFDSHPPDEFAMMLEGEQVARPQEDGRVYLSDLTASWPQGLSIRYSSSPEGQMVLGNAGGNGGLVTPSTPPGEARRTVINYSYPDVDWWVNGEAMPSFLKTLPYQMDNGGSAGFLGWDGNFLVYEAAWFKRPLTDGELQQLDTYSDPRGFRMDTFDLWEQYDMAIRRALRGAVGVAGLSGTGINSVEKASILSRLTAIEAEGLGDHNNTAFGTPPYTSGHVVSWNGTNFVLSAPATGLAKVKRNNVDIVVPTANLDFSTAFTVANGGSGEADIGLTFGTAAGTVAEGNHAHTTPTITMFRTASGSLSNITAGAPTVVSGSVFLQSGVTYAIGALLVVEQYGNSGSNGLGYPRVTINGNAADGASVLTAEQGVDSPKIGGHSQTIVGAGASVTISGQYVWNSGVIRPQEAILMVFAIPSR